MCLLGLPQDTWPLRSYMPIWYVSLPGTGWHCLSVVWSSRVASDPAWGVVQGFRWQLWLRVMLSHVKLPYPGRPQVRGSEINRGAVGFQLILLVDSVQVRAPLYSYPTLQLPYCFTMYACADFIPEMQSEFHFIFPRIDRVIFDNKGRCALLPPSEGI